MHRRSFVTAGDGAGVVLEAGRPSPEIAEEILTRIENDPEPQPEAETSVEMPGFDGCWNFLISADCGDDAELEKKRSEMIWEADNVRKRLRELCVLLAAARNRMLVEKQESLRETGRLQKELRDRLENQFGEAENWFGLKHDEKQIAMTRLTEARESKKRLSRWATKAEIAAADRKIEKAVEFYQKASQIEFDALAERNRLAAESNAANKKYDELIEQDEQLKRQLAGKEVLPYGLGAGAR